MRVKYNRRYVIVYYFWVQCNLSTHRQWWGMTGHEWLHTSVQRPEQQHNPPRCSPVSHNSVAAQLQGLEPTLCLQRDRASVRPSSHPPFHRTLSIHVAWRTHQCARAWGRNVLCGSTRWGHGGGRGECCNEEQLAHQWRSSGLGLRLSGLRAEPPPGWDPPRLRSAPRQLAARRERARAPLLRTRD